MQQTNIREARRADNQALLRLTELSAMKGNFELLVERKPDFFSLLKERGPYFLLVAERNKLIVGSIAASVHEAYVLGERRKIYYVSDFKVHPELHHSRLAFQLAHKLHDHLVSIGADLLLSTSIEGNRSVEPFFQGRMGISPFTKMKSFKGYQILPKLLPPFRNQYNIEEIQTNSIPELCDFYNSTFRQYAFAPSTNFDELIEKTNLVIRKDNRIIAAISLADYQALKQNIVKRMPAILKLITRISRAFTFLIPGLRLPLLGEPIKILYIKRIMAKPEHFDELKVLLNYARKISRSKSYSFLNLATHPDDRLNDIIGNIPKLNFKFNVWISSLRKDTVLLEKLKNGIIWEDYALI